MIYPDSYLPDCQNSTSNQVQTKNTNMLALAGNKMDLVKLLNLPVKYRIFLCSWQGNWRFLHHGCRFDAMNISAGCLNACLHSSWEMSTLQSPCQISKMSPKRNNKAAGGITPRTHNTGSDEKNSELTADENDHRNLENRRQWFEKKFKSERTNQP